MQTCPVCGDLINPGIKVCALCGSSLGAGFHTDTDLSLPGVRFEEGLRWEGMDESPATPPLAQAAQDSTLTAPAAIPLGPASVPWVPPPLPSDLPPAIPITLGPGPPAAPAAGSSQAAPPAGTRCLVLYGPDKTPLQYFPLRKDVTLIGRLDPLRGTFPDINLEEWLDEETARKVSRKHAVVLHTRLDDHYSVRPLAGNTGTQIDQDMVEALKDYALTPGTRLILGGCVRFKFEIAS